MSDNTLIAEEVWGQLDDGQEVLEFHLRNGAGAQARFTNYGAALIGFSLPWQGEPLELVLGCDTLDAFIEQRASLGATVGRVANRIGNGRTEVEGQTLQLETNGAPHHLHGGSQGFGQRLWDSRLSLEDGIPTLVLRLHTPDGDAGYPGAVDIVQTIQLLPDNQLSIDIQAKTDQATLLNLTNHAYFNLGGDLSGELKNHEFRIHAERYTEADETALPTGQILPVDNSVLDLREWTDISPRLATLEDESLLRAGGYDHNFIMADSVLDKTVLQAEARNNVTGFWLKCFSNQPGVQFYSGNFLGGTPKNAQQRYLRHGAFCFEPGLWPDSNNHDHFPDAILRPGETYHSVIIYQFGQDDPAHWYA
ncbi:aldose epimerase family protein [Saccharospirillum sp. MSK14-1]|uniref:aldose epimerase family protein n=1 Tax=Saccharospirillum sp. MSK14-1 TaxID=1897632 RepID=UPI001304F55B|nr:aldose epimerase family protein [Saccharospirillum sp. MSK14-1]